MPNSSPSLLPGFARSSFSISCALHHVASSSRLQLLPVFFSSLHHLLLVSVHLRQLAVAVARATPRALVEVTPLNRPSAAPFPTHVRWQRRTFASLLCKRFDPSSAALHSGATILQLPTKNSTKTAENSNARGAPCARSSSTGELVRLS